MAILKMFFSQFLTLSSGDWSLAGDVNPRWVLFIQIRALSSSFTL
jgi:hypothetical protein